MGSDEIYEAIQGASDWVYAEYGDPVKKTYIFISGDSENESYTYDFTGDMGPVHQVRLVTAGNSYERLVSGSSYTVDFRNGNIKFNPTFHSDNDGELVRIEWVPKIYNHLVKYKAAMDIVEMGMIIDGQDVKNPIFSKLERNFNEIRETLRPTGIYTPDQILKYNLIDSEGGVAIEADYIGQKINRQSLRFS